MPDAAPLFVKSGRLLPLSSDRLLELHLYGPDGSGSVYHDAGDGYGASRVDHCHWQLSQHTLQLSYSSSGDYQPEYERIDLVLHGCSAEQLLLNQRPLRPQRPGHWTLWHSSC